MAPVEWPIAAASKEEGPAPARGAEGDRLPTVRADLLLDPALRLTEQERAFMTGMMADLVDLVVDEITAAGGLNDNGPSRPLFDRLRSARLLDIPELLAVILRRAEEERLCSALRAPSQATKSHFLHALAADADESIASAAMALVLGRSRRRDRFGGPRVLLDDLPAEAAVAFVHAVAAAVGENRGDHRSACRGAQTLLAQHDEGRRLEALGFALVHALESANRLDEHVLRSAMADGEIALLLESLSRTGGIGFDSCWTALHSTGGLAMLLRIGGFSRPFAAETIAALGDLLPAGAAGEMEYFDHIDDLKAGHARDRLRLNPTYRAALAALAV
jgi:hypothetical protein